MTFEAEGEEPEFANGGSGALLRPGGRDVAEALAQFWRNRDFCVFGPVQHSFYGWSFGADGSGAFGFLLQHHDQGSWLLICEEQRERGKKHPYSMNLEQMLRQLHRDLSDNSRFTNVRWYTRKEYDANAKGEPLP